MDMLAKLMEASSQYYVGQVAGDVAAFEGSWQRKKVQMQKRLRILINIKGMHATLQGILDDRLCLQSTSASFGKAVI